MKYSKKIFIIIFLFAIFTTALFAFGGEIFAQQNYVPLSPLPGDGGVIDTTDPASYFARMFAIFVGLAAVIAVIMLVICGFQYMTSDAISSKESAKKRCWAAILGLGLILISWIILNTINPNLLKLPFASLQNTLKQGVVNPTTGVPVGPAFVTQPFCYVSSNGTIAGSFADATSCNAARDAEIASLQPQIEALTKQKLDQETVTVCNQLAFGPFNPYYFPDKLGGVIVGGPFCGIGNVYTSSRNECDGDVVLFNAPAECMAAKDARIQLFQDQINQLNGTSACSSNPSC